MTTTDPKPISIAQARDLLQPGLREYDPEAELWIDNLDDSLILAKAGQAPKAILSHAELMSPDWKSIAKTRLGWPT